jgi:hypothetical protein
VAELSKPMQDGTWTMIAEATASLGAVSSSIYSAQSDLSSSMSLACGRTASCGGACHENKITSLWRLNLAELVGGRLDRRAPSGAATLGDILGCLTA